MHREPELQQQRYPRCERSTHRGIVGYIASHSFRLKSRWCLRTDPIVVMDFSTKQVMMCGENGPHGRVPR